MHIARRAIAILTVALFPAALIAQSSTGMHYGLVEIGRAHV